MISFVTSQLMVLAEVVLILLMFALLFFMRLRRKQYYHIQAKQFSAIFNDAEQSKAQIKSWLAQYQVVDDVEEICQKIYEQEKILASSIQFAYLNKGKEPLITVKEKLDLFINGILSIYANSEKTDTPDIDVSQL